MFDLGEDLLDGIEVPTGPEEPHSTVLSPEEEAIIVAFRKHTLLPLDDCLYALQPTIPHLSRSSFGEMIHWILIPQDCIAA